MNRLTVIAVAATVSLLLFVESPSGARQYRVAYVTPVLTAPSPRDLWGQGLLGFRRAVKDFGVEGRIVQGGERKSWATSITSLARQKFDLIFPGLFFSEENFQLLVRLIRQYPKTMFVVGIPYKYFSAKPKNVQGSEFRAEESAYLAGYLAALMEQRRPGRNVISSVGGIKYPNVDDFIAGYQAGARKADPRVATLNAYSGSFSDPAKCRATALQQIAKGSGVVFNVAGGCGPGTLRAAKEKGVWAIGVDVDQSFYGPQILTSAIKRGDIWIYKTVQALVGGKLETGRSVTWNLRNGGVGLGKISPKVPRSFLRRLQRIRTQIVAGKIKVPDEIK